MNMEAKIAFIYEQLSEYPNLAFSSSDLVRIQQKSNGAFYHALKRLESRGHIVGRWEGLGGQEGNRVFRYQLTPNGMAYVDGLTYDKDGRVQSIVTIEPVRSADVVFTRLSD